MSTASASEISHLVDNLVGRLSGICDDGNRLRDFPPDFTLSILKDLDAKLQQAQSFVKTITNAYSPVNRVPVEILNTILSLTIDSVPNFRPTLPRDPYYGTVQELNWPYRHFAKATSVCRYWRTVTLHFASNWNTVQIYEKPRSDKFSSHCSQFASLCLSRAAATPLDIALYNRPSNAWWEHNLLAQSHRFRSIVLDDVDILPLLCRPAPQLTSLTIEPTWRTGGRRPSATIPTLFAGHAPNLRYLSIRYFVPWPTNVFSDLTHLCLQGDGTSPPYNFAECLEFLESTPKLEELIFAFVESVTQDSSDRTVSLPHLNRVAFYNCSQTVVSQTLSHVVLPPSAVLTIRFQRHGGWRPDRESDYFECLPADIPRVLEPLALNRFCMVQDDAHAGFVRFVGAGAESAFDLYPGLAVGGLGRHAPTSNVLPLLAGCRVEELWTSPVRSGSRLTLAALHPTLDEHVWRALFGATPHLRRLVLGDWRRYGVDDDGCLPALASGELCPDLAELFVIGDWAPAAIQQLAKERANAGHPIERVVFRRRAASKEVEPDASLTRLAEHRWFKEQADALQELAESGLQVDFVEFQDFSESLPEVCFDDRHAYWGSWKNPNSL